MDSTMLRPHQTFPQPFPSPVPMPYLTPLYKAYINDPASIRQHIFLPLEVIWKEIFFHGPLPDQVARLECLAAAKEEFTIRVSYSSASSGLKRALFELPLEDIFETCVRCFPNFQREHIGSVEVARWFAACAMHPQADPDKSLAPYLQQYSLVPASSVYARPPIEDATYAADSSFCGDLSHMTFLLEHIDKDLGASAYLYALEAFVQLGANVVDMFLFHDRYTGSRGFDSDDCRNIILEGLVCVSSAWANLLDNPFGKLSPHIRAYLGQMVDEAELTSQMLAHIQAKVRVNSVEKDKHKLHSVMWTSILRYAANLRRKSRRKLGAVIRNALNLEADQKIQMLIALAGELPNVARPVRTTDEVTAELFAHVARFYSDEDEDGGDEQDVPIESVGPEIDPLTLGRSVTEAPANELCPVCRGDFSSTEEPIMALNACGHPFHVDCLAPWINRVLLGLTTIQCPYCRAQLCNARDYRGVVEE